MNPLEHPQRIPLLALAALLAGGLAPAAAGQDAPATAPEAAPAPEPPPEPSAWEKIWSRVTPGTQWFLSYGFGEDGGEPYNRFQIERGYLTLKFAPLDWLRSRVTMDTTQDDSGDFKMRLKYLYGELVLPLETAWITKPSLEFGLVHGPWLDFEEHVNRYRMEGTMLIERNGVLNSADLGLTLTVLLGEELPAEYQSKVSKSYPGTWGSLQLGAYNGGGYHAVEQNQNKTFQSRLSIRPAGPWLPGLQLSWYFIWGKGNTEAEPDFRLNLFMASFEHEYFVLAAQAGFGHGNQKGSEIDAAGAALGDLGFSGFAELKLPWIRSALIGRYDWWRWGRGAAEQVSKRFIVGYAFFVYKSNAVLVDLDRVSYDQPGQPADWQAKLTLQVEF